MPRKNKRTPHQYFTKPASPGSKTRFATKRQAEEAANHQMLLKPDLQLHVYRDIDGGWYLTRQQRP